MNDILEPGMILRWLSRFWPALIILSLVGVVAWKNVLPGTYLTGWDNLHSEFDFVTNIVDRGINGVWQYYQGLGVPSGNAHVADLPRQIVLWISSWVVPQNLIRYGYHLTAWLGGGIGLYFLILMLVGEIGYRKKQAVALVGSIFYLFNLGTLQNFYAPYESFSHFYLMLPWLLYVFLSYLQVGGKRKLLWLLVVNLLAVPMSYIPTIFIVYMIVMGFVGLGKLITNRLKNWKRVLVGGLVILLVNSFWLLPFAHFVSNNTKGVVDAKINRMFTQEAFLRNEEYGELKHSLIMEGFWFDTTDMTMVEGQHDFMMRPWMDYMSKLEVKALMWTLVVMVVMGYLYALINRKKYSTIFLSITLIGLFALINTNWPTGGIFKYLQANIPLFGQVMRLPFTKFILLVVMGYSVGIAWFMEMVMKYARNIGYVLAIMTILGILFVQRPVFEGHFFYDNLRLKIPDEYFELFKFFQNEDRLRGRIANLPQPTFWGWTSYGWGYRGSGFPWYGIPQPILDRNFDVWSSESEQYYSEISNAIYDNNDQKYFLGVLDQYGVDYVWIDHWVINPQKPEMLNMSQVENWLKNGGYTLVFEKDKQVVYKKDVSVIQNGMKNSGVGINWDGYPVVQLTKDVMGENDYLRYGDNIYEAGDLPKYIADRRDGRGLYGYLASEMKSVALTKPELNTIYNFGEQFPNLDYDERVWWMREIYIAYDSEKDGKVQVCLLKQQQNDCYYLGVNDNPSGGYRWGRFVMKDTTSPKEISFRITGDVKMRELRFGYFNTANDEMDISLGDDEKSITYNLTSNEVDDKNCYQFGKGEFSREVKDEGLNNFVRYTAIDASSCETMYLGNSEILAQGGTISLQTRNVSGRPVKFCLRHDLPGDCLVEEIVKGNKGEWITNDYQIRPITRLGDLYLEIDSYAVGNEERFNDVGEVVIKSTLPKGMDSSLVENIYSNNQAFRRGWIGIDTKSLKVLKHVKVDGWANGWMVNGSGEVTIFYWPQLLEYLGFVLLGLTAWIVIKSKRHEN